MKPTLFIFFFLLLIQNLSFAAITCPPAHLVERKIENRSSRIQYQGLWYHIDKTLFDYAPYQLSKVSFIEAEISSQKKITCAYEAFSSGDMKWGDILLTAHHSLITPHAAGWFLDEGVQVCVNKEEKFCSFKLG